MSLLEFAWFLRLERFSLESSPLGESSCSLGAGRIDGEETEGHLIAIAVQFATTLIIIPDRKAILPPTSLM